MKCSSCGNEIPDQVKFCPKCGKEQRRRQDGERKEKPASTEKKKPGKIILFFICLLACAGATFGGYQLFRSLFSDRGTDVGKSSIGIKEWGMEDAAGSGDREEEDPDENGEENDSERETPEHEERATDEPDTMGLESRAMESDSVALESGAVEPKAAWPTSAAMESGAAWPTSEAAGTGTAWPSDTAMEPGTAWPAAGVLLTGDYIIEDSAIRYLAVDDLAGLTLDQLRLARNEIYARHGRLFRDEELQAYFNSKSWYNGTIEPGKFSDQKILNDYEKKNLTLIQEREAELKR